MRALKKYLITLLVGMVGVIAILASKDIFAQTVQKDVYHILCDAFFVVGVLIECVGLLIFSSNEGTFDIIVYGVSSFVDMFKKRPNRKYETFYDYRVARQDKKIKFAYLLIVGLVFLAVSGVMLLLYHQC